MAKRSLDRDVKAKSQALKGKEVGIGVCGGIGSVEVIKIIRELRRHGAEVTVFFTPSTQAFVTPLSVEWAAGSKVVRELGAEVEHLDQFDLVVIVPATLNTISKSVAAICDNPVTLLIASQLGRKAPLVFVPTMNAQLLQHPAYREHVTTLRNWGAFFMEMEIEEDRVKMPPPVELVEFLLEQFFK